MWRLCLTFVGKTAYSKTKFCLSMSDALKILQNQFESVRLCAIYCVVVVNVFLQMFHIKYVRMGVVIYDLLHAVEIVFGLCKENSIQQNKILFCLI